MGAPKQNKKRPRAASSAQERHRQPVIAAVGASAGGLEAITNLLSSLPSPSGLAVIVVQHLDPHHESHLAEPLGRATSMPVVQAVDGTQVAAEHVYVIPPNANLGLKDGKLTIKPRVDGSARLAAIDLAFASIAEDVGNRALGVILSGTGSDGTAGLAAIQAAGGVTFVQTPTTAAFTGMPDSAIRAQTADVIADPKAIGAALVERARNPYSQPGPVDGDDSDEGMTAIRSMLLKETGVDFSDFKTATFQRRMHRRMSIHGISKLEDYVERLRSDPKELRRLHRDALINVTHFFREPKSFDLLRDTILPPLLERDEGPIRIWVPGCSSGEEVYSLALTVFELLGGPASINRVQFFGTDLDAANIARARQGRFSAAAMKAIPDDLRNRYFTAGDDEYQVARALRDICVFSVHNIYRDPPFSNIDLISCRNVLIYARPEAQQRALTSFHYGLRPDGILLLGSSETTGPLSAHFRAIDSKVHAYAKLDRRPPTTYEIFQPTHGRRVGIDAPVRPATQPHPARIHVEHALLAQFVPSGVTVDATGEVIEFVGRTGDYLEHTPGRASLNLYRMARDGLDLDLRSMMAEAEKTAAIVRRRVQWTRESEVRDIMVQVMPVPIPNSPSVYVVTFEALSKVQPVAVHEKGDVRMQAELDKTQAHLRATIEQYEDVTEDLRAVNEEAMSINEEAQSTNEELQTTGEELQSANEELTTLNEELHNRNKDLTEVNLDLENLLTSVRFPIVFLGKDLNIRSFTPSAGTTLRLIPADIGRPLQDLRVRFGDFDIMETMRTVMADGIPIERELQDEDEHWWLLRANPYRTAAGQTNGAVLVLIDVEDRHRVVHALERSNQDLSQFAAFAAHELREPLRHMRQYLDLIHKGLEDSDQASVNKHLYVVRTSLDRIMSLLTVLLDFSQVQAQTNPHHEMSIGRLVASASAESVDVTVRIAPADGDARVFGDEALLQSLLVNLFTNAAHHHPGSPKITVATVPAGQDWIEVSVTDDGPGIEGSNFENLFTLYSRGKADGHHGHGLGLAVCRRIVEVHGGKIWATNEPGASIHFTLPTREKS